MQTLSRKSVPNDLAGHLVRMNDDRLVKQVFSKTPNGTRRGRKRTKWVYLVDNDVTDLGIPE
uniref:Uncharacterized protein n=1 Tax=Megaselia scalaris TaxID=36166 RepID=T1GX54_MEGSC